MPRDAIAAVVQVAEALGPELLEEIVFIGGAIAPLLQTDPPFPTARPTGDVDAIVGSLSYARLGGFSERLRARGFREMAQERPMHRWLAPTDPPLEFDIVPAGTFVGSSGNPWDVAALETAVTSEIGTNLRIRHVDAPGFLALKFGAFQDRGADDPFTSHDLEDILALIAARSTIVEDVASARADIAERIVDQLRALLSRDDYADLVATHLNNVGRRNLGVVLTTTEARLRAMAGTRP